MLGRKGKKNQVLAAVQMQFEGTDVDLNKNGGEVESQVPESSFRDDFYDELNLESLINYWERNEIMLKESHALKDEDFKFTGYGKQDYRQLVLIYKKKKKTLVRKLEKMIQNPALQVDQFASFEDQVKELKSKKQMLIEQGGLKDHMQSYDYMDSEKYSGVQDILHELVPDSYALPEKATSQAPLRNLSVVESRVT